MKTLGIIAEYNPFHNGHAYQIQKAKEITGADCVVVVMSGDFVQRGTPAWTDKYLRTQMALANGVDFVFELPVCFATASAEYFALAGVSLLTSLGFVDILCFGSECGNLASLEKIADFFLCPPDKYHSLIQNYTSTGLSYPAARKKAFLQTFPNEENFPEEILDSPNNILAIEYLKALKKIQSPMTPFTIPRTDFGYHSRQLATDCSFASASALRKASISSCVSSQKEFSSDTNDFLNQCQPYIPKSVHLILKQGKNRFPITEKDFSPAAYYRLCHLTKDDRNILDMSKDLYYRITKNLSYFNDYASFVSQLKTKQFTYTRISRVLLHLLLDITKDCIVQDPALPYVPYGRLLGFSKTYSYLLHKERSIPIITKPADGVAQITSFYQEAPKQAIHHATMLYEKDCFAANLYARIQGNALSVPILDEYRNKPLIKS